jgi:hypothetical protein
MQGVCQSTPGRAGRSKSPAFGLAILVAKIPGGQLAGFPPDVRVQRADKRRTTRMAACKKLGCLQSLGVCAKRRMIVLNMGS